MDLEPKILIKGVFWKKTESSI